MKLKPNPLAIIVLFLVGAILIFLSSSAFNLSRTETAPLLGTTETIPKSKESEIMFGLAVDSFEIRTQTVQKNQSLSVILEPYQVDPLTLSTIVNKSKPVFDIRKLRIDQPYTVFSKKDDPNKALYFVYQPNLIDYIVYDLRDSVKVYKGQNEVSTKLETVAGIVTSSLYYALQESGSDPAMATSLANIYGGVVDFYSIQQGDYFKIQYERQYIKDAPIGQGKIQSAIFSHRGKEFHAFYFKPEGSSEGGYYDENGNSMRRAFLKAPLKFSRISSRYSKRRLHPVQKVWKAHLGTDYAAPHGTPIIATADGVVTEARFTNANGNYVKIKHNKVYATQYLHMSKRAVKNGQRVRQGQVIGYVGSTGLATGPHVCYRFWENGRQIDALRKNFQAAEPLEKRYLSAFSETVKSKQLQLAAISHLQEEVEYTAYQEVPPDLFKYFGQI